MSHSRANAYTAYYRSQVGGGLDIPVFVGGQHGAGLGDILRGVLRFFAPIALRGLGAFASSTLKEREKGATYKEAARSAIAPTLSAMTSQLGDHVSQQQQQQSGSGGSTLFNGIQGVPYSQPQCVYKAVVEKRKHIAPTKHKHIAKRKHSNDDTNQLNF